MYLGNSEALSNIRNRNPGAGWDQTIETVRSRKLIALRKNVPCYFGLMEEAIIITDHRSEFLYPFYVLIPHETSNVLSLIFFSFSSYK